MAFVDDDCVGPRDGPAASSQGAGEGSGAGAILSLVVDAGGDWLQVGGAVKSVENAAPLLLAYIAPTESALRELEDGVVELES